MINPVVVAVETAARFTRARFTTIPATINAVPVTTVIPIAVFETPSNFKAEIDIASTMTGRM